ncbi:MAG: S8 family serine peptidase [Pirellulales bacterium]|nr:S8 family serine peptidase [Pirellulales bacterium]
MSQEITEGFDRRRELFSGAPRDRHCRRRLLRIEPLETRQYLSGDGLVSSVSPTWFQDVAGGVNDASHIGAAALTAQSVQGVVDTSTTNGSASASYDWIVQFNTAAVQQIASVAEASSLLVGGGVEFDVIRGLGLVGQVLVRSYGSSLETAASALLQNTFIAGFEQDAVRQLEVTSDDPQTGALYGLSAIDAPEAWSLTTGSRGVVVGVIDTGIDYTHPDLAANVWTNPGEIAGNGLDDDHNGFVDDVHGYDFINDDGNPLDDNGHGTHVSGTIAAVGNNGLGVVGVNWSTSLMGLKFLDADGSGYTSDAVRAINYATMMRSQYGVNLRVLNNSWGGGGYSSQMAAAIQANNDAGIFFVAAAGNSGSNNDRTPQYPANYNAANVVSVAAVDAHDALASFSCYGASTVDLAAPGVSILSTIPGNRYARYSGTSMATPHVAGAAALAWAYNPDATVAEVRDALLQGTDVLGGLSGKVATGGRLNVYATLQRLGGAAPTPTPVPEPVPVPVPEPVPIAPTLQSLTALASVAAIGDPVTLVAAGAVSPYGIHHVDFYADANHSGALDSGDQLVGADYSVVDGRAELTVDTGGLSAGTHSYFARAVDSRSQMSDPVGTSFSLASADDYGNNPAAAAPISVGATLGGTIESGGDVDWFRFQAEAGTRYAVSTALTGLRDSVLYLYGSDGATLLAWNDDSGGTLASSLTWTAPAGGQYYLQVKAYSASQTGGYRLSLVDSTPAPAPVPTPTPTPTPAPVPVPTAPTLDRLTASPAHAMPGTPVTLVAEGAASPSGQVFCVYFYADSNVSGVFDSGDRLVGADFSVIGGRAEFTISTGGLAPGTYHYFARAFDGHAELSNAVGTSFTLAQPSDDYGNSPTAAAPISVGATLGGMIQSGGDVDWFRFQAEAGSRYTVSTALAGLRDSVLYLYGQDGATLLAWNDDSGGTLASSLTWTATAGGQYYLKVQAYSASQTGDYRLSLSGPAPAPASASVPLLAAPALGSPTASPRGVSPGTPVAPVAATNVPLVASHDSGSAPANAVLGTIVETWNTSAGRLDAEVAQWSAARNQALANHLLSDEGLDFFGRQPAAEDSDRSAVGGELPRTAWNSSAAAWLSDGLTLSGSSTRDSLFAGETAWNRPGLEDQLGACRSTRELVAVIDRLLSDLEA